MLDQRGPAFSARALGRHRGHALFRRTFFRGGSRAKAGATDCLDERAWVPILADPFACGWKLRRLLWAAALSSGGTGARTWVSFAANALGAWIRDGGRSSRNSLRLSDHWCERVVSGASSGQCEFEESDRETRIQVFPRRAFSRAGDGYSLLFASSRRSRLKAQSKPAPLKTARATRLGRLGCARSCAETASKYSTQAQVRVPVLLLKDFFAEA
jgi:hypothetical protein